MPTPSPQAQAIYDECLRLGAAIAATQDAPCGVYSSHILQSLAITFQGLVMTVSLAFAAITFAANSGVSKIQFFVKMRSRMNLPFFLGATLAYGSLIFIYQGPNMVTIGMSYCLTFFWSCFCIIFNAIALAYWMRELGFSIHYGAIFLKMLSELRHRPLLRLERISAASASNASGNHALTSEDAVNRQRHASTAASNLSNRNNQSGGKPNNSAPSVTSSLLHSTQVATHQAWLRASNKLNQTRLNKSSIINFIYILLVPVVALSVWTASFASLPVIAARRALCFIQPWTYVVEGFELAFIAVNFALSVRVIYKGGQSPRMYGPLFEIKLFKLLAALLANEFIFSTTFYIVRHLVAVTATSDMMALAHLLRDNLTITLNLMAVFIFKVAIRGGQMGSRTNLSSKSVTANKVASSAANTTGFRPLSAGTAGSLSHVVSHVDDDNADLLAINTRLGDVEEANEAAQCIEIAELKRELRRVQMQAEYYRVKAMRKDNPHLSSNNSCGATAAISSAVKKPTESSVKRSSNNEPQQPLTTRPTSNNNNNNNNNSNNNNNNSSVLNRVPPAPPTQNNRESALKSSLKLPSSSHSTSSSHR